MRRRNSQHSTPNRNTRTSQGIVAPVGWWRPAAWECFDLLMAWNTGRSLAPLLQQLGCFCSFLICSNLSRSSPRSRFKVAGRITHDINRFLPLFRIDLIRHVCNPESDTLAHKRQGPPCIPIEIFQLALHSGFIFFVNVHSFSTLFSRAYQPHFPFAYQRRGCVVAQYLLDITTPLT